VYDPFTDQANNRPLLRKQNKAHHTDGPWWCSPKLKVNRCREMQPRHMNTQHKMNWNNRVCTRNVRTHRQTWKHWQCTPRCEQSSGETTWQSAVCYKYKKKTIVTNQKLIYNCSNWRRHYRIHDTKQLRKSEELYVIITLSTRQTWQFGFLFGWFRVQISLAYTIRCSRQSLQAIRRVYWHLVRSQWPKGGRTPIASRQASRHETKETTADVSIVTQTGVRRFS
jgi:hypothetical protein